MSHGNYPPAESSNYSIPLQHTNVLEQLLICCLDCAENLDVWNESVRETSVVYSGPYGVLPQEQSLQWLGGYSESKYEFQTSLHLFLAWDFFVSKKDVWERDK